MASTTFCYLEMIIAVIKVVIEIIHFLDNSIYIHFEDTSKRSDRARIKVDSF